MNKQFVPHRAALSGRTRMSERQSKWAQLLSVLRQQRHERDPVSLVRRRAKYCIQVFRLERTDREFFLFLNNYHPITSASDIFAFSISFGLTKAYPDLYLIHSYTQKLIMAIMLISLFGCFQKKEKKNDLPTWLEANFPGQLVVVNNVVNLDPMNLFIKEKNTILADKNDPEVQIRIKWFKKEEGLGLNMAEVQTSLDNARKDVKAGRMIFDGFKKNGLEKFSVGVIEMAAYILLFDEQSPELRKNNLTKILTALDSLPDHAQTSIWIEWMEPSAYQQEFKDIIPYGYWQRGDSYHDNKKIMSLDFEWSPGLQVDILNTGWAISTKSDRSLTYKTEAYNAASTWAAKNLKSPFYLENDQMITIGPDDEDPMAIEFGFPYFTSKPDTTVSGFEDSALGYVRVVYQTDQKTFGKIKRLNNDE